jgi:hypothetical protein
MNNCSNGNSSCANPTKVPRKTTKVKCDCYVLNKTYKSKMLFKDSCGELIDPAEINIFLTKPDGTVQFGFEAIKVDTGFYYYETSFPILGDWKESWLVAINGEAIVFEKDIKIINNPVVTAADCGLDFNSLIVLKLSKDIAAEDGSSLNAETYYSFSTEYNPFYCSTEMLRMEMGSWVDLVPDDTLALAIHWSSLEADNITGVRPTSERYLFARTRFVMFDAAIKLFSMPVGASSPSSGKQKQLGDLLIENGGSLDFNLKQLIDELKAERDEWWRVVNAGGCIVPGQGLGPTSALKGDKRVDKNQRSREWHDPWNEPFLQPTQNSMYKAHGEKKYKHGYSGWNEYYYSSVTRVQRGGR